MSRHYCDVHQINQSDLGVSAIADPAWRADYAAHSDMFFSSPDLGLEEAAPGTFPLTPAGRTVEELRRDYARVASMIIGDALAFEEVLSSIVIQEEEVNR